MGYSKVGTVKGAEIMLECKDCCLYNTDACRYGKYALEHNMSIQCDDFIVEHNKAYQQGRADVLKDIAKIIDDYACDRGIKSDVSIGQMISQYIYEQTKEHNNEKA